MWTLATAAVAAVLRLWAIGFPHQVVFDEVYYVANAQELLRYGYEDNPDYMYVVHPPVGKWLIALTTHLFGDDTVGWRLAPAIAGILSVLILTRVAMRMLRSVVLGVVAGLLLSLDGISLVMSRVALLDIFLQFFILAGFAALVLDRDQMRSRLGALYAAGVDLSEGIPRLGPRPWRLVAGVMFGFSFGVKWSALSFWLGFALMSLLWDRGALRSAGVLRPWSVALKRSYVPAFFSLGVVPVASYLFTWLGWFVGENSFNRHWGDTNPGNGVFSLLPSTFRGFLDYHHRAYQFHTTLTSPHPYKANPWSWLILGRPISFYAPSDTKGCGASSCTREILLIGTPLMYWAILPVLVWLAWHWVTTRDWRAGAIGMAFIAGWVVWLHDIQRTGFLFYMTPLMPYLMIGLAMAVGALLSIAPEDALSHPPGRSSRNTANAEDVAPASLAPSATAQRVVGLREWLVVNGIPISRLIRTGVVTIWFGAVVADFIWMWPIFTGGLLTNAQWTARMWFPSWI